MVRPWLADLNKRFGLNKRLWAEAYATAVYTKNRLPHSSLQDMTPYEVFHRKKPSISHLQPFSRKSYIPARSHTFIISALDVKFESMTADSCPGVEVTTSEVITLEVITSDVTMLDLNSDNSLTSTTSISFARPITCSIADSQQKSIQPQQPPQQVSQPQHQSQSTAIVIPPSLPDAQRN